MKKHYKYFMALVGMVVALLISVPVIAKYHTGPIDYTNIEQYQFNKITQEDLQDLPTLTRYYHEISQNAANSTDSAVFSDLFITVVTEAVEDEQYSEIPQILVETDQLLARKVKAFEAKFGADELGRPYIIFTPNTNVNMDEGPVPPLTEAEYQKVKEFAQVAQFPTYEEYKLAWIDLDWMYLLKDHILSMAMTYIPDKQPMSYDYRGLRIHDYANHGQWIINNWYQELYVNDNSEAEFVWYYLNQDGFALQEEWLHQGVWYYFDSNYRMQTGWLNLCGTWYYFKDNGAMCDDEWIPYNGAWYYFKADGSMAANETINGWTFNTSGACVN